MFTLHGGMARRFAFAAVALFAADRATSFSRVHSFQRPTGPTKKGTRQKRHHCQATPKLQAAEEGGVPSTSSPTFVVALTREEGKNDKLLGALLSSDRIDRISDTCESPVQIHEIPCIEHADGPDADELAPALASSRFDYVAITSPEAARVMASAWVEAGRPELGMVAAVGKATQETLKELGIVVSFVPSKATAATLARELPPSDTATGEGRSTTLLYPSSAKAADTLRSGLEGRGCFVVSRLNTYDTVHASWSDERASLAGSAHVACFASPSAVKAWMANTTPGEAEMRPLASCIGETSARACKENGWEEAGIFYPEKPGVDGWAASVADALEHLARK